jgi:hypothetical protein
MRMQSSLRVLRRFGWVRSPVFWEFARVSREIEGWTPAMIRLYTTPTPAHPHILICFWRIRPAGLLLDSERRDFAITSILVMAFAESSTCKRRPRGEMASYCSSQDYWCAPRGFWGFDPRKGLLNTNQTYKDSSRKWTETHISVKKKLYNIGFSKAQQLRNNRTINSLQVSRNLEEGNAKQHFAMSVPTSDFPTNPRNLQCFVKDQEIYMISTPLCK